LLNRSARAQSGTLSQTILQSVGDRAKDLSRKPIILRAQP
jgi:hypothetical protein